MAFKPNYCNSCGDKIERADWSWTTSRRFCDVCETNFRLLDWTPRITAALCLILAVFALGELFRKPEKSLIVSANQPSNFVSNQNRSANSQIDSPPQNFNAASVSTANANLTAQQKTATAAAAAGKALERTEARQSATNGADEKIYFCGAQTKKGTPCTRRVRGGGRCWQHTGQPAMLPQEKLIAN